VQGVPGNGLALMLKQRRRFITENLFDCRADRFNCHDVLA
jgi:hypothetical protein